MYLVYRSCICQWNDATYLGEELGPYLNVLLPLTPLQADTLRSENAELMNRTQMVLEKYEAVMKDNECLKLQMVSTMVQLLALSDTCLCPPLLFS